MFAWLSKFQKWRIFQATDFQSLMYPCFIIGHILGVFPYEINASTFKISKPHYILSTVLICAVCVYEITQLYNYTTDMFKKHDLGIIVLCLERICYCMCTSLIAIATYILSSPRMRLLQAIMNVSSKLTSKTYKELSRLIHAKDIFGFFFNVVMMMSTLNKMNMNPIIELFSIYIMLLEVFQTNMLYLNCVYILKACFKRINDNLVNLCKPVVKDMPYTFSQIYYKQKNLFLLMELKDLKKQHLMISDTMQILNLVFSLQLLATIFIIFSEITFFLYFYAWQWSGLSSFKYPEHYWYIFFTFLLYQILRTLWTVWACEAGKNQALEIGTTIQVLFNKISDADVKDELQLFALQISHCKNVFSTKFFDIDMKLLTEIVGNITTYLLILIQFLFMIPATENIKNIFSRTN